MINDEDSYLHYRLVSTAEHNYDPYFRPEIIQSKAEYKKQSDDYKRRAEERLRRRIFSL